MTRIDFGKSETYPYGIQWVAISKQELRKRVNSREFTTVERLEAAALLRMTPKTNTAEFGPGELQVVLGVGRSTLHDAIARAVARRTLHPGSNSRRLAVRGQLAQAGKGTATRDIVDTAPPFAGVRDRPAKMSGWTERIVGITGRNTYSDLRKQGLPLMISIRRPRQGG